MRFFFWILLFFASFLACAMEGDNSADCLSENDEISRLYQAIEILFGDDPSEILGLIEKIENQGIPEQILSLVASRVAFLLDPKYCPKDPAIDAAAQDLREFVQSRKPFLPPDKGTTVHD